MAREPKAKQETKGRDYMVLKQSGDGSDGVYWKEVTSITKGSESQAIRAVSDKEENGDGVYVAVARWRPIESVSEQREPIRRLKDVKTETALEGQESIEDQIEASEAAS